MQAMTETFTFHVSSREPMEFAINNRSQVVESNSISITPGPEQLSHLATSWPFGPVVQWCVISELRPSQNPVHS